MDMDNPKRHQRLYWEIFLGIVSERRCSFRMAVTQFYFSTLWKTWILRCCYTTG